MYKAKINVTLRKSILDPKGKASKEALHNLGYHAIEDVRIGKFIELNINAGSETEAEELAREACSKLLANEVMEDFTVSISK
jgi:phosphoribosylformylglycinamidine synthase